MFLFWMSLRSLIIFSSNFEWLCYFILVLFILQMFSPSLHFQWIPASMVRNYKRWTQQHPLTKIYVRYYSFPQVHHILMCQMRHHLVWIKTYLLKVPCPVRSDKYKRHLIKSVVFQHQRIRLRHFQEALRY